jgi:hypothetical protein
MRSFTHSGNATQSLRLRGDQDFWDSRPLVKIYNLASPPGERQPDFSVDRCRRDARWKRPYTDLTYLPQIELLKYLRANGYKTYIVTGGGHALLPPPQSNRIEAAPRLSQKDVP